MPTQADVYYDLAVKVAGLATTPGDLRSWWTEEKARRDRYGLSADQTASLIDVCARQVAILEEGRNDVASNKPTKKRVRPKI